MGSDLGIERQQPDAIPLVISEIAEAGGEDSRVIDLLDFAGAVIHGSTDVEKNENARVRLTFVQLYIQLVAAGKNVPIDAPDFVARHVLADGGETHPRTPVGGNVGALKKYLQEHA